ncbi:MAG: arginine N-succinyltransferase [Methylotenera sp.]|nr:arginine N-succinyltransferase [Oligoflexia bacterium]
MILLREIQEKDLGDLERFSKIPGFINLPDDPALLLEKIQRAVRSFRDQLTNKSESKYMFVAVDTETDKVVGTSMIAAQHGSTDAPHFYFEVGSEEKFSETINTGFIHGTLKLKYDSNGPSEIGGLVLDPELRNSDARVGRQISFVRFLFLGLNKSRFKRKILAELLPPLNVKGLSPLWEAIGRRFTNMDYWEADQLCQQNKEFIFSLFPSGKIYTTFLAADARNSIGKVGKQTEPVLHMLKKIGFTYKNQVDPFDGGPHLWANVDDLLPLKKIQTFSYAADSGDVKNTESGLLCKASQNPGEFRAVTVKAMLLSAGPGGSGSPGQPLAIQESDAKSVEKLLGIKPGDPVVFMPYY